jgi:putative flavoprotein involved in K+ transport
MLAIIYLLGAFIADLLKSQRRLKVENLFLHHQLNIISRRPPQRRLLRGALMRSPQFTNGARLSRAPSCGLSVLLGRVRGADRDAVFVAPDLEQSLADADAFAHRVRQAIDSHALRSGIEDVHDDAWPEPNRLFDSPPISGNELHLKSAGITSIIWACGYRPDFHWIKLPIFDWLGFPVHRRGVSDADGLYFLGLPWLYKWKSATLLGAGEDAAFIAQRIASR